MLLTRTHRLSHVQGALDVGRWGALDELFALEKGGVKVVVLKPQPGQSFEQLLIDAISRV